MLDPSSSEEESDEGLEEESRDVLVAAGGSQRAPPAPAREGRRDAPGRAGGGGGGAARSVSPSPSVLSEGRDEPERQLDDEQERRIRLQLYVFVVRCIAYPFNAKQPTDMARRQQKGREIFGDKTVLYPLGMGLQRTPLLLLPAWAGRSCQLTIRETETHSPPAAPRLHPAGAALAGLECSSHQL
ncbi:Calcium-dependent secretion activator 2 [Saguinus oedipus]|uniref:Calcium-dependent secretion activator 2 n=1 Tax=Saguinus oedipus TaxID=9490 RepID=A0ABQ9UHI7_SAGOE|nr:Calcium-dependent secretion activator 2 [Saguinus oedipus]